MTEKEILNNLNSDNSLVTKGFVVITDLNTGKNIVETHNAITNIGRRFISNLVFNATLTKLKNAAENASNTGESNNESNSEEETPNNGLLLGASDDSSSEEQEANNLNTLIAGLKYKDYYLSTLIFESTSGETDIENTNAVTISDPANVASFELNPANNNIELLGIDDNSTERPYFTITNLVKLSDTNNATDPRVISSLSLLISNGENYYRFSRAVFDPIPLLAESQFKLTYYLYF